MPSKKINYKYIANSKYMRTWLGVWLAMKNISIVDFARVTMTAAASVHTWARGGNMSRRQARLIRAFYPDCPIHRLGGPVYLVTDKLPMNARSWQFYRFIFNIAGIIKEPIHADALAQARGMASAHDWTPLEPSQG